MAEETPEPTPPTETPEHAETPEHTGRRAGRGTRDHGTHEEPTPPPPPPVTPPVAPPVEDPVLDPSVPTQTGRAQSPASAAREARATRVAEQGVTPAPVPEVTGVTGDARYDQERKVCVCGSGYFVGLNTGEVHVCQSYPFLMLLPPIETGSNQVDVMRLPMAECAQCGTRYDRLWREVS